MSQYIKKIRTDQGDLQIDYNSLANLPDLAAQGTNSNLLINGDFRNPINQRGSANYNYETANGYTIDRWCIGEEDSSMTVYVTSEGITIAAPSGGTFKQLFEQVLPQGNYTLSVKVRAIEFGSATISCGGSQSATTGELSVGVNTLTINDATASSFVISLATNSRITLEWAKLEVGTSATQFEPRLKAEELLLCQRYFQRVNLYLTPGVSGNNGLKATFTYPCRLRDTVNGSLTAKINVNTPELRTVDSDSIKTTLTVADSTCYGGLIVLNFNSSANLGAKKMVWSVGLFEVFVDAEIH